MKIKIVIGEDVDGVDDAKSGWALVNFKTLLGVLGASACLAWLFLMVATDSVLMGFGVEEHAGDFLWAAHLACVSGVLVGLGLCACSSDLLSRRRAVAFSLSLVLAVAGYVCVWFYHDLLWGLVAGSVASGLAASMLYALYGEYLSILCADDIELQICLIFLFACLLCGGTVLLGESALLGFSLFIVVGGYAGYLSQLAIYGLSRYPFLSARKSRKRSHVSVRSYLSTVTSGMMLGFGVGCMLATQPTHSFAYTVIALAAIASCGFLLYDTLNDHWVDESTTMRLFLPFSAPFAFLILFVPDEWKWLPALVLLCGSLVPTTCSLSALERHIAIFGLGGIDSFSIGRFMSFAGILVGMILAFYGFSQGEGFVPESIRAVASVCIYVLLVIISASFIMTEDNYPSDERVRTEINPEGAESPVIEAGVPLRQVPKREVGQQERQPAFPDESHKGEFSRKVECAAREYGLSKRQEEVLFMLAKGRNAKYITDKLVISPHTAKAHIYNIYLKMDVHSQQELMDKVENCELD